MKICYLYKPMGKIDSDDTEGHIAGALRALGHMVAMVPEENPEQAISVGNRADLFFFHKGGRHIEEILARVKAPRVFWYFDKVWNERIDWMDRVLPLVTMGFLTDGDEAAKRKSQKLRVLRQGIARSMAEARWHTDVKRDVVFFGDLYGERGKWAQRLDKRYGERFEILGGFHGQALVDAIGNAKVVVAPLYPSTDRYWSNRLYLTLGCGGLLVHPKLAQMEFVDGEDYLGYRTEEDMFASIDWALKNAGSPQVARIRASAHIKVRMRHTIEQRVERLIREFQEYASKSDRHP